MVFINTIEELLSKKKVESALFKGSKNKKEIQALQTLLNDLGFGSELNWDTFGADGIYGKGTTKAVKEFATRNDLTENGETVTSEIAQKLIDRFNILDDLRYIKSLIEKNMVEDRLFYNSSDLLGVVALQTLLKELGFFKELKWDMYGADGKYGYCTSAAVVSFGDLEGIEVKKGYSVTAKVAAKIIKKLQVYFGSNWVSVGDSKEIKSGNLNIREANERGKIRIYVSDGKQEVRFSRFKKGVYYTGKKDVLDAINRNKEKLRAMGLTDSAQNVMLAVSENEGKLDAINTWDNSFMTFGMFQWTIGAGSNPGELASLIAKVKSKDKDIFHEYYGQYGLDFELTDTLTGYFILDGEKLVTPAQKEKMRTMEWAYYFWKSGQNDIIQSIQILHALSRLDVFYSSNHYKINGHYISDLITSEYGIGLLLDNHVNRPGYVKPCLEKSLENTNLEKPQNWGTEEEAQLISEYLKVRAIYGRYPMTHADKRAAVTKKYLDKGTISADRHSFLI
jgi:peptidoglycan hydrolase-like protein with peptidoglycan-binding domain